MGKPVKDLITIELRKRFEGVEDACVVDISGMSVFEQEALRTALREKSARLRVIKNSMARRAWKDTVLEPLGLSLTGTEIRLHLSFLIGDTGVSGPADPRTVCESKN